MNDFDKEAKAWDEGVDAAFRGAITRQNAEDVKRKNPYRSEHYEGWTLGGKPLDLIDGRLVKPGETVCVHHVGLTPGLWCGGCQQALEMRDA